MFRVVAVAVFLSTSATVARGQSGPAEVLEKHLQKAVEKASPAVAAVIVSRRPKPPDVHTLGDPEHLPEYFGTGVLIDRQTVLTYYHIVRGATAIAVRLAPAAGDSEPKVIAARIFAGDTRSNLATLRLDEPARHDPIEIGRAENLRRGSLVACLGAPFTTGFRNTESATSLGIVSALNRRLPTSRRESEVKTIQQLGQLIEVDVRPPSKATGAALVDLDGRLVGLVGDQGQLPADGASLALPIDWGARRIVDVLRRGEEVEYGLLGVTTNTREENAIVIRGPTGFEQTPVTGVRISDVTPNGPADRAGIAEGDRIVAVNDQPIRDYDDMFLHIGLGLAGQEATIRVRRGDSRRIETVKVRLAKYPLAQAGEATQKPAAVFGLRVDYASVLTQQQRGFMFRGNEPPMTEGVVVREIESGSPAASAGLGEYRDFILAVNGVPTPTPADFYREAGKAKGAGQPVTLRLHGKPDVTLP